MRMEQRMRSVAPFVAAGLLLSACGGSGTDTGGASEPAAAADCEATELTYWNGFSGPDGEFMKQLVDDYNAENERGDTVRVTTQPFTEYYDKISAALTANKLPDVMIIHLDQLATWAARGALRPLDGVIEAAGLSGDDFPDAVWEGWEYDGSRYGIPLDIHPMTLYYNTELLADAGLDGPPTTGEEFEQYATAMTDGSVKGYIQPIAWPSAPMAQMMLFQYGGRVVDEAGEKAAFNSDAGVKALEHLKRLRDAEFSRPDVAPDAQANDFKAGTNAMTIDGIWMILGFQEAGVEFSAAPVPQFGDEMHTWAGSHQLTIGKNTDDPCKEQAAGEFIAWLTDNAATWAEGGQIPARMSARESEEFQALELQAAVAPSVDTAIFPPPVPGIADAYVQFEQAVNEVLGDDKDVASALADAEDRANQLLEENRQRYGG